LATLPDCNEATSQAFLFLCHFSKNTLFSSRPFYLYKLRSISNLSVICFSLTLLLRLYVCQPVLLNYSKIRHIFPCLSLMPKHKHKTCFSEVPSRHHHPRLACQTTAFPCG